MPKDYTYAETIAGVRVLEDTIIRTDKGNINAQELFRLLGVLKDTVDDTLASIEQSVANVEGTVNDVIVLKNTVNSIGSILTQNSNQINTLTNSVTDINDTLNLMASTLTSNKSKITALQSDVTELVDGLDLTNTAVNTNTTKISTIISKLSDIDTYINDTNGVIETINTTLATHSSQIATINGKLNSLNTFKTNTQNTLETIGDSLTTINNTLTGLNDSISTITSNIQTLNTLTESHTSKITALETLTQEHETKLTDVLSESGSNTAAIEAITISLNSVVQTATNNKTDITSIKQALLNENTAITANADAITINKNNITAINTSINGINQTVSTMQSAIESNDSDIVALQDGVTAANNKNDTQDSRLDGLDDKTDNTNQEVQSLKDSRARLKASVSVIDNTADDVLRSVIKHGQSLLYIDSGSDNTFIVSRPHVSNDLFVLFDNMVIKFLANNKSTDASTLKVNTSSALPIKKNGLPLKEGDIIQGFMYEVVYDIRGNYWRLHDIETQSVHYDMLTKLADNLHYTGKISFINNRFSWREDLVASSIYVPTAGNPFIIPMPSVGDVIYNIGATGNVLTSSVTVDSDGILLADGASLILRVGVDYTYQLLIADGNARTTKTRIGDIVIATRNSYGTNTRIDCCDSRIVAKDCVSFPNTNWIPLTLDNNWVNYGSGRENAEYRIKDDNVEIRGMIKKGSYNKDKVIAQLPIDYRIKNTKTYKPMCRGGYSKSQLDMKNDGNLTIIKLYNNTWVVIDVVYSIN